MIDNCGRNIDYIRISVTDRCNLRCVYCMPEDGVEYTAHEDILTYEEILRLCKIFTQVGISKVKITGGEPLTRLGVSGLIKQIKAMPGMDNVTLTTNAVELDKYYDDLVIYMVS